MDDYEEFIKIIIDDSNYIFKWISKKIDYIEQEENLYLCYDNEKPKSTFSLDKAITDIKNDHINCSEIINIINLMTDFDFNTETIIDIEIYDKLFYGCNLPAIKSEDKEDFHPKWTSSETNQILECILQLKEITKKIKKIV